MRKFLPGLIALRLLLGLTLLCGGVYPLLISALARGFFPHRAGGSLVTVQGRVIGSQLLAQNSPAPGYFHPRPSACGYNTLPGSASNLPVSSSAFRDSITCRRIRFQKENGLPENEMVPMDMLCASASGLDPHISPAAARMQVARVAAARRLSDEGRRQLEIWVGQMIEPRQWGFLGEPRVNVLLLNFMLDNSKEIGNFYTKSRSE